MARAHSWPRESGSWMCPCHSLCLQNIASYSFPDLSSNPWCNLQVHATWPLWHHQKHSILCDLAKPVSESKQFQRRPCIYSYLFPRPTSCYQPRRQDSLRPSYNDHPTNYGSSALIAFTHSPLVNGFGHPTIPAIPSRSSLAARHLISASLKHHASLSPKVTNGDDPDLQPTNIILGDLPPADMLLNYHCSAFPTDRKSVV